VDGNFTVLDRGTKRFCEKLENAEYEGKAKEFQEKCLEVCKNPSLYEINEMVREIRNEMARETSDFDNQGLEEIYEGLTDFRYTTYEKYAGATSEGISLAPWAPIGIFPFIATIPIWPVPYGFNLGLSFICTEKERVHQGPFYIVRYYNPNCTSHCKSRIVKETWRIRRLKEKRGLK
jgi:hypothetical protein